MQRYIALLIRSGCLLTNHEVLKHLGTSGRGSVIIANHPSILDAPIFLSQIPNVICVFKSALKQGLLLSKAASILGYLSNDTGIGLLRGMVDALEQDETVLIFPEGTRTSAGGDFSQFNRSYALAAMRSQVSIQLVYIDSDTPILSKRQHFLRAGTFPGKFNFELGPTIEPGDFQTVRQVHRFVENWYRMRMENLVPSPRTFLPVKCCFTQDEAQITASFTVPESPFYCLGHMPGNPLVPGYVQMAWVREVLSQYEPRPVLRSRYIRWKFIQPILPSDCVTIVIVASDSRFQVGFYKGESKVTQGRVILELDSD
ncbi:lysophospholipid acyltransferase family protein [Lentimonas sp. CC10]|uniref:lysophospholipid acyltransferase family protein n=1 Tax=Lentimonas sp. CC10 TaxID=2676095 RepID=UPI001389BCE5|nr:lysophospholipid acyltransferase family protein [Lentimonas sp. CC10]